MPTRSNRTPRPTPLARRVARRLKLVAPAGNLLLCVAQMLARSGTRGFSLQAIRDQAVASGIGLPPRPASALRSARRDGELLFRQDKGVWTLTRAGVRYFRAAYGIGRVDPEPRRAQG